MPERLETLIHHEPCQDCAQHFERGSGCRVVEEGADVPLDAFLSREPCFLKEHLRRFSGRYLAHRPRSLLDPDDLAQEVSTRLLTDEKVRAGGFARGLLAFLAYLRRTAIRSAISAERRERGRMRCGNCRHYAPYSGRCLKTDHAWTHREIESSQDPRALEPACRHFVARREPKVLSNEAETRAAGTERFGDDRASDVAEAVHAALLALAEAHPRAALVVRARLLDGKTYEALTDISASVRTMKRDFAFGTEFLRRKLAAFDVENLASEPESGRSPWLEKA